MTKYQSIPDIVDDNEDDSPIIFEESINRNRRSKRYVIAAITTAMLLVVVIDPPPTRILTKWLCRGGDDVGIVPNGDRCYANEECESGFCCNQATFGSRSTCQSCCNNFDCFPKIEQPPAGEFGKPFCVENQCVAEGPLGKIPKDGYPVWAASETIDNAKEAHKYVIPRIVSNDLTPRSDRVWYFDFKDQADSFNKDDVVYNGTHIKLPTYKMMHAAYSRSYYDYDEHETGIVTMTVIPNKKSIVSDYPKVGFVEKYHTLTHKGKKDTSRGDFIRKASAESMKNDDGWTVKKWLKRGYTVSQPAFASIESQVEGGLDRALNWQIRRYANSYKTEDIGKLNPDSSPSWAQHTRLAKEAFQHAKNETFEREYVKSEQHCKHIEEGNGVEVTDSHFILPLGRPLTTLSGEMVNSPVYYLGLIGGYITAHYDENESVLQLYYQGFAYSRSYSDVQFPGPYPTALYVSPVAEGSDYAIDPEKDGRSQISMRLEKPADDPGVGFGIIRPSKNPDFTLWRRPRSETCLPKYEYGSFWEELEMTNTASLSDFEDLMDSLGILKGLVGGAPCANIWMRSDYGRDTNGFSVNEIGVWAHTLTEVPDGHTKELVLAEWWDSWECFYRNKDPALCCEDGLV